jgi:hypothetical protein
VLTLPPDGSRLEAELYESGIQQNQFAALNFEIARYGDLVVEPDSQQVLVQVLVLRVLRVFVSSWSSCLR